MVDILDDIITYIESQIQTYAPIKKNVFLFFDGEYNEIIARQESGDGKETRYMDGSRNATPNISFYAKSKDQDLAQNELQKIIETLDLANVEVKNGLFITLQDQTTVWFDNKTEIGEYIFGCTLQLEYNSKGV